MGVGPGGLGVGPGGVGVGPGRVGGLPGNVGGEPGSVGWFGVVGEAGGRSWPGGSVGGIGRVEGSDLSKGILLVAVELPGGVIGCAKTCRYVPTTVIPTMYLLIFITNL